MKSKLIQIEFCTVVGRRKAMSVENKIAKFYTLKEFPIKSSDIDNPYGMEDDDWDITVIFEGNVDVNKLKEATIELNKKLQLIVACYNEKGKRLFGIDID